MNRDLYSKERDLALIKKRNQEIIASETSRTETNREVNNMKKNTKAAKKNKAAEVKAVTKNLVASNKQYDPTLPDLGIGDTCRMAIMAGWTFQMALEQIKKVNPEAQTTKGCWNWYKQQLRGKGYVVPSHKRGSGLFPTINKETK